MKRIANILTISALILLATACGSKDNTTRPQTGYLLTFGDDSCHCINYNDAIEFSLDINNISLFYNDLATVQCGDGKWGYINRKGEYKLSPIYDRTTVFSEGLAWVMKGGDMPGAINERGDIKISLRDAHAVRAFHEGRAAVATAKKREILWGFLDKNGYEVIKPQYKAVTDFRLGLAAVQETSEGKWGYINLKGETVVPCQYDEAYPFDDEGNAIVKDAKGYRSIDRQGNTVREYHYSKMIPDRRWARVFDGETWGWCNEKGECVVTPAYEDCRPFGDAQLAPVKIRGKWGYIDRNGRLAIKRQFTEAYPFVEERAAVKTGTVWGFINNKGIFAINPQYDFISQDYLYQVLGIGSAHATLNIE